MTRNNIIEMFNKLLSGERKEINFSKGYKDFEDIYNNFKEYNLKRTEKDCVGYTIVTITK